MYTYIDTPEKLEEMVRNTKGLYFLCHRVLYDNIHHPLNNPLSVMFLEDLYSAKKYAIIVNHSESTKYLDSNEIGKWWYLYDEEIFNLEMYKLNYPIMNPMEFAPNKLKNIWIKSNKKNVNRYVSLTLLAEWADNIFASMKKICSRSRISEASFDVYDMIVENGLKVDVEKFKKYFPKYPLVGDVVYTKYNPFTTTGRPSNSFGGVSFSALNNDNGARESFVSRFGSDGILVSFDYDAYHLRIIADMLGIPVPQTSLHDYFGKIYFDKEHLTIDEYEESKKITFECLYGENRNGIPFFNQINDLKKRVWESYQKQDGNFLFNYYKGVKAFGIESPTPSKVFNYCIQASETAYSMSMLKQVLDECTKAQSKLVLYTYDSILIDFCFGDGAAFLNEIRRKMLYPVRMYAGVNYGQMKLYK